MFQGGLTAADERGQLFAVPTLGHFNINSPNGHFQLHTQNVQRVRLNGNVISNMGPPTAPPFLNVNRDGFMAISGTENAFNNVNSRVPFTRLHLVDDAVDPTNPVKYAQEHGFRPWQRNGITFTGNSDQSYIGHKYGTDDNTDFVVQWSDNPNGSPWGVDRMKFVFTTEFNAGAARGAATLEGLEAMRLWPRNNNEVNVGIGDFAPPAVGDPTERVDMLNGRLRIRQLPDDAEHSGPYRVMVVDDSPAPSAERGVVKWATMPTNPGGADCDWTIQNAGTSGSTVPHNVYTATGTSDECPDKSDLVGIGTSQPAFKLDVRHSDADLPVSGAIQAYLLAGSASGATAVYAEVAPIGSASVDNPTGVRGRVSGVDYIGKGVLGEAVAGPSDGNTLRAIGVEGTSTGPSSGTLTEGIGSTGKVFGASGGTVSFASGVYGEVTCTGAVTTATAVEGIITGSGASTARHGLSGFVYGQGVTTNAYGARLFANGGTSTNYGVYAEGSGSNAFGGYFIGDTHVQGNLTVSGTYPGSDAMLKTDVQGLTDPLSTIALLQPMRYSFLSAQFPQLALPEGEHMGFVAQEVQAVLPGIVRSFHQPARFDSLGAEIAPSFNYLGVNYTEVIPLLVAGMQQQQAQIAQLQAQLNACCASPSDDGTRSAMGSAPDEKLTPAQERLLRIAPNPFTDRTTLYCTLERAGRVQLMANSSDGRDLRMLSEGQREAGEFQYEWSTEQLAPGVYYVTLLLDGEPVVKRAVKVGR
ncbi:MAG: tail fiber domain-containing protein [Flavobacteriales bacterium]